MKYVSIDIETTGLDSEFCQIIEFGAIIDNGGPLESLPVFHRYVNPGKRIRGEPYALAMNHKILAVLAGMNNESGGVICVSDDLMIKFENWLWNHFCNNGVCSSITVAGKNFGSFDLQFLKRLEGFGNRIDFGHRFIDPSMLYFDPKIDSAPPSTFECYKRAGLPPEVTHTALEDAMGVIKLLRAKYVQETV